MSKAGSIVSELYKNIVFQECNIKHYIEDSKQELFNLKLYGKGVPIAALNRGMKSIGQVISLFLRNCFYEVTQIFKNSKINMPGANVAKRSITIDKAGGREGHGQHGKVLSGVLS